MTLASIGMDGSRPIFIDPSPGFDTEMEHARSSGSTVDPRTVLAQIAVPAEVSLGDRLGREVVASLRHLAHASPESSDLCGALADMLTSTAAVSA